MINLKQLCAAIDAYAFLQTGLRKTGQFKSYRPVAIQKHQDGMDVYIPLKFGQTIIEEPVKTFAEAFLRLSPIDGQKLVSELSPAIREIPVVEHIPYNKCLKIGLTQGDISAAACVTDWNKVLPAEVLRAFDDCYSKKQLLKIATIASLEDVDTKFKTDEYNLIVAADGTYYDMTPVDHRELVRKGYSEALDENGSAMRLADFSDNVILTDATNNKLVVSNTMGYIVGLDMSGYRPFSIVSARQLLRDTYISYNDVTGPYYSEISTALEEADRKIANTTWASWFTMLVNTPTVAISQVQNKLEAYWTSLLAKTQEDMRMSYYQYLCTFRPLVKSLLYYGKKIPAYDTAKNMREESAFDCDVSNLPGVQGYMPHQVDVLAKTKNSKLNVLQVGTGGGKSLITITDISNKLKSGQIKKPLVIMPTKLLGQYSSEIFNFSENNLNCFVYGRDTAASYKKAYDMKRDAIEDADKNLPPNTIYLVGYDLLKSSKDFAGNSYTKSYLGQEQDTYPIADYLAKQGFDAVYLDEAHKIKNESGRLSRIVRSILTGVDYITCMSGTLIYNNVKDLQSIVSICAPEASRYDYEAKGYLNAMNDLDIKFIAKEQKDWAAFLPKFKDYLVPVRLPESYAEAYKNAEQEIMTQIINDPTLAEYKAYLSGESDVELDEEAEEKIQFIMNMRFNKLETIINAPDKAGFDAISPKVKAFDDIIDAHEAHGKYANIDFSKSGDKKIFAFGYNKNVSEHIYNHSKHKDIICWYHGDKNVITQFLTDPKKRVLLADITSIAEGWNFQVCDTCVPGNTRVLIDEHTAVPIKDIYDNPEITHVLGYDLESKKIKKYKILDKSKKLLKPEDNTVRIEYVDSRTGKCGNATFTGNHKIYTKNRGYVRADEITSKDILVTFGGKFEDMRVYNGEILSSEDKETARKRDQIYVTKQGAAFKRGIKRLRKLQKTSEYKATLSKAIKRAFKDPVHYENLIKSRYEVWQRPEYREKMAQCRQEWLNSEEREELLSYRRESSYWKKKRRKASLKAWDKRGRKVRRAKVWTRAGKLEEQSTLLHNLVQEYLASPSCKVARKIRFLINCRNLVKVSSEDKKLIKSIIAQIPELAREARSNVSKAMWSKRTDEEKAAIFEKILKTKSTFPNHCEQAVIDLGIDNLIPTGDGSYWVTLELNGKKQLKNPDFIVNTTGKSTFNVNKDRTYKVVEIIGDRKYTGRDKNYDKALIKAYKKVGIECLILDEGDCRKKNAERLKHTKARLESFVNNHYLVIRKVAHNVNFRDKYKYDLTIDKVHNFFVAGHRNQPVMLVHNCIALQQLFTPGQTQQAIARVFRPKIGDASRPVVHNIAIAVNNTVDMVKFARLLYKKCMVNSVYYANDPAYNSMASNYGLNKLPRVSLSIKSITEYEDDASLNQLGFFTAATALNDWNSRIIDLSKAKLIKDAADRLGKNPADIDLAKDILIPATHNERDIDGSKKVWTAKPVGFSPKSNALTLEQAIANLLSDFTGPESEEKSVIKNALQGARVITAFGPGIIYRVATARSKPASTITIGSNNIVLANSEVFIDDDPVENALLQQMLQAKPTKPVIPVKELQDELTDEDISDDLENDDSGLDIYPGIVNNQAALVDTNGYKLDGFVELGPILYSKIKNKSTIAKILDFVTNSSDYDFDQLTVDELEKLRQRMVNQAKSYATESKMYPKIKKWARLQKLPSKTKVLEPFIVYVDDEAMLCISLKHSRHARKLIGKKFTSGMTPFKSQSNFSVLFAKGPNSLAKELKKIESEYSLNNAQETYDLAAKVKVKSKI